MAPIAVARLGLCLREAAANASERRRGAVEHGCRARRSHRRSRASARAAAYRRDDRREIAGCSRTARCAAAAAASASPIEPQIRCRQRASERGRLRERRGLGGTHDRQVRTRAMSARIASVRSCSRRTSSKSASGSMLRCVGVPALRPRLRRRRARAPARNRALRACARSARLTSPAEPDELAA